MKHLLLILTLAILVCSCSQTPTPNVSTDIDLPSISIPSLDLPSSTMEADAETSAEEAVIIPADSLPVEPMLPVVDSSAFHFMQFDLVTLQAPSKKLKVRGESLLKTETNKLELSLDLGSKASGHFYTIEHLDSSVQKIELYQRYETSMSITDEGKHRDLLDWKHHVSEWEQLEVEEGEVMTPSFIPEEYTQFPDVKVRQIVKEVKRLEKEEWKTDSRHWSTLAKTIPAPGMHPSYVTISKVYVKMVLTLDTGEVEERIITYDIPMGC